MTHDQQDISRREMWLGILCLALGFGLAAVVIVTVLR